MDIFKQSGDAILLWKSLEDSDLDGDLSVSFCISEDLDFCEVNVSFRSDLDVCHEERRSLLIGLFDIRDSGLRDSGLLFRLDADT